MNENKKNNGYLLNNNISDKNYINNNLDKENIPQINSKEKIINSKKSVVISSGSSDLDNNIKFDQIPPNILKLNEDIDNNSQYKNNSNDSFFQRDSQSYKTSRNSSQNISGEKHNSKNKQKRNKFIALIVGSLAGIYFLGVILFVFLTFPRTYAADADLSLKTRSGLEEALNNKSSDYLLKVEGKDYLLNILGRDIEYQFDVDSIINKIEEIQNPFAWPIEIFNVHDFKDKSVVNYNEEKADSIILTSINNHNSSAIPAQDAAFKYNPTSKTIEIKQEITGNTINTNNACKDIKSALGTAKSAYILEDYDYIMPTILSGDQRVDNALMQANTAIKASFSVLLSTTNVATVDINLISNWLYLSSEYKADLNMESVNHWANDIDAAYSTIGSSRSYTTAYGKAVTVSGGSAGWSIDTESLSATTRDNVMNGFNGQISCPCNSSLDVYNGPGQRDWGSRYIDVDLSTQTAYMYDAAGSLIWQTEIVSGRPDGNHNTPTGVYTINNKESPSVLKGLANAATGDAAYETKVQYWMAFVGNGVGFHDATWQSGFGGNRYTTSAGSHGCVNISLPAAQSLFSICNVGDVVVVHE